MIFKMLYLIYFLFLSFVSSASLGENKNSNSPPIISQNVNKTEYKSDLDEILDEYPVVGELNNTNRIIIDMAPDTNDTCLSEIFKNVMHNSLYLDKSKVRKRIADSYTQYMSLKDNITNSIAVLVYSSILLGKILSPDPTNVDSFPLNYPKLVQTKLANKLNKLSNSTSVGQSMTPAQNIKKEITNDDDWISLLVIFTLFLIGAAVLAFFFRDRFSWSKRRENLTMRHELEEDYT